MVPLILETSDYKQAREYLDSRGFLDCLVSQIDHQEKISIDEIKQMLHLSTYQSSKVQTYLIHNAHNLTLPAQNILLKSLEESRPEQLFVLITHNSHSLLGTILSRCQLVVISSAPRNQDLSSENLNIIKGLSSSISECLKISDVIGKSDPKETLKQFILQLRQSNLDLPTIKRTKVIKFALQCLHDLSSNLNPKLSLDHFLLKSHKVIKMKPANGHQ